MAARLKPSEMLSCRDLPSPGTRIGPYEIVAHLGSGGMGEVYRARDAKLQRDVALKLLPPDLASDADRLARLTREAQLLASLNHPNIAAIYGVEESAGGTALVLELVEGPTLADRVAQGPIPLEDAVPLARQIADALEAAHEHGIIHRDLKPANIKVRHDGTVKVLDFGLAKAVTSSSASGPGRGATTQSPTLTDHATAAGVILGTAAYMSPEQARGRAVDRRADIWAFGVVLFEMLAGRRPFDGETISDALAAVIKDPPSWTVLPEGIPPSMRHLLGRMLEKDPRRRLRDIGDARLVLEDLQSGQADAGPVSAAPLGVPVWQRALPWVIAAGATAVAGALIFASLTRPAPPPAVLKYTLPITGASLERTATPVLSPDGRHVAYVSGSSLWIQDLDEIEPRALAGTNGAQFPFWAPDSREVAYLTSTALWRVGLDGSQPVRVASYRFSKGARTPGGAWRADDTIVFSPAATGSGLLSVPAQGGEFAELYARDPKIEGDFHRPSLMPDGRSLLFVVDRLDTGPDTIGALANGARKDILRLQGETLDSPVYSSTGHILYHRETTTPGIWALPFSAARLEATGPPFLVVPQGSFPNVSANGTLIYVENSLTGMNALVWFDLRTGAVTPALTEQFPSLRYPSLSPDGRQVAAVVETTDQSRRLVVADLRRDTHVQLGERPEAGSRPTWRDDRTLVYARDDAGQNTILMSPVDGSGSETVLTRGLQPDVAAGQLLFIRIQPGTSGNLYHMALPPAGAPGPDEVLQQLPVHEWQPTLSPDGSLLAYTTGDGGQSEVVLRTYPGQSGQWRVSANGGASAMWSRAGDVIYYRDRSARILRVEVRGSPQVTLGTPQLVARPETLIARLGFDISPDGTRFLMVQQTQAEGQRPPAVAVVQNWYAEFRK